MEAGNLSAVTSTDLYIDTTLGNKMYNLSHMEISNVLLDIKKISVYI